MQQQEGRRKTLRFRIDRQGRQRRLVRFLRAEWRLKLELIQPAVRRQKKASSLACRKF